MGTSHLQFAENTTAMAVGGLSNVIGFKDVIMHLADQAWHF
jgi:hypothetical protein